MLQEKCDAGLRGAVCAEEHLYEGPIPDEGSQVDAWARIRSAHQASEEVDLGESQAEVLSRDGSWRHAANQIRPKNNQGGADKRHHIQAVWRLEKLVWKH